MDLEVSFKVNIAGRNNILWTTDRSSLCVSTNDGYVAADLLRRVSGKPGAVFVSWFVEILAIQLTSNSHFTPYLMDQPHAV